MQSLQNHITIHLNPKAMFSTTSTLEQQRSLSQAQAEAGFLSKKDIINCLQVSISLDEIKGFSVKQLEILLKNIAVYRGKLAENNDYTQIELRNRMYTIAKSVAVLLAEKRSELLTTAV